MQKNCDLLLWNKKQNIETSEINLFQTITFQQDTGRQLQKDLRWANHFQCECSFNYKAAAWCLRTDQISCFFWEDAISTLAFAWSVSIAHTSSTPSFLQGVFAIFTVMTYLMPATTCNGKENWIQDLQQMNPSSSSSLNRPWAKELTND